MENQKDTYIVYINAKQSQTLHKYDDHFPKSHSQILYQYIHVRVEVNIRKNEFFKACGL